ncbi:aldose 1-epimerase [Demequina zhanjiangensis]|uniref:Aldose 1-epimerase n=1 Tax=Demequina zhanjiangensis TaxID=3051659 RepID=A0ABT8G4I2_9MICO|nr:aldose 1-epimerase [Demequina sp. SYSU T00b26]MDN4473967.1 aldose 1-epimerase [Demequina sp. SYSU T00b26]
MDSVLTLDNDIWRVGLAPTLGGSIASGAVQLDGTWVDVMRPTPADATIAGQTASFPLVPWSNRISGPVLRWKGKEHPLRATGSDGTAIHGVGLKHEWTVAEADATHAVLTLDSRELEDPNFPWPFTTTFTYTLDGATLVVTMAVTNVSDEEFPAGLGHHPYFERQLTADGEALGDEAELQIRCGAGYELVNCLPTGGPGPIRAEADYRDRRPLGHAHVDDCLTDRVSPAAATIIWPGALRLRMEAEASLSHIVVYVPEGKPFFAVEPVSHANDALRLAAEGVPGVGVRTLAPGETFTTEWSLTATPAKTGAPLTH